MTVECASGQLEPKKAGCGRIFAAIIGVVALIVFALKISSWILGDPTPNRAPSIDEWQRKRVQPGKLEDALSIGGFTTTVGEQQNNVVASEFRRLINIRYDGRKNLENVELTLVTAAKKYPQLDLRENLKAVGSSETPAERQTETHRIENWRPGETKSIQSKSFIGRAVTFEWSGKALVDGQEVRLNGGRGSHQ